MSHTLSLIAERIEALNGLVSTIQNQNAIATIDLRMDGHPRYSDPRRLFRDRSQVCSQNDEDGIIREIFRRIGTTNRVFVEIGVGDGTECNTAFLLTNGWTGFWIDGQGSFLPTLERLRLPSGTMEHKVAYVTRENVSKVFQELDVPEQPDILSIDVDANTYHVWAGLAAYRPRVVIVEYNSVVPADVHWTKRYAPEATWDGSQNFGASLKAFEDLGRTLGYALVGCDFFGINAFFVRNDLVAGSFAEPYTADNHYEPPRYAFVHRRGHHNAILDPVGEDHR